jgi:hypothetical protein
MEQLCTLFAVHALAGLASSVFQVEYSQTISHFTAFEVMIFLEKLEFLELMQFLDS